MDREILPFGVKNKMVLAQFRKTSEIDHHINKKSINFKYLISTKVFISKTKISDASHRTTETGTRRFSVIYIAAGAFSTNENNLDR